MSQFEHYEDLPLPLPRNADKSVWVFAYGSLIWQPGFEFEVAQKAKIFDYHRSFCVKSTTYRGTVEMPGLVMGLDKGGFCTGKAFKLDKRYLHQTMDYLYQREMDTDAYIPSICPIRLYDDNDNESSQTIEALTFVVDTHSPCYASGMEMSEKARIIKRSTGNNGTNVDYVMNTYEHLLDMGIDDSYLRAIIDLLA